MAVIPRLASSLGRNDEEPNQLLAAEIRRTRDEEAVSELVEGLLKGSSAVKSDCIKVLYEIGEGGEPHLIAPYATVFVGILNDKNNRLVWGAMTALSTIAHLKPDIIIENLEKIKITMGKGSVITVDRGVTVLALAGSAGEDYEKKVLPFLIEHLETCQSKQLPQHAERSEPLMNSRTKERFKNVLEHRLDDLTPPQQKRVMKIIKKLDRL